MPAEGYESTTLTIVARQRLRDLHAMFVQHGVPKGIVAPKELTLSSVVELLCSMGERELKRGKRR
jgi:hypothetical protein